MAEQDQDKNLDNMLDSLLATYSDAEPRPSLETRVMAQLRAEAGRKKSWKWSLSRIWAGAAAVAIVVMVLIARLEQPIELPHPPVWRADFSLLNQHSRPVVQIPGVMVRTRLPKTHQPGEKLAVVADQRFEVFPTPAPLSDQEKLLLKYLSATPRQEIVAQSHSDKALEELDDNQMPQTMHSIDLPVSSTR
jgi:hypothetical protein